MLSSEIRQTRNQDLIKEPFIKVPGRDFKRAQWTGKVSLSIA